MERKLVTVAVDGSAEFTTLTAAAAAPSGMGITSFGSSSSCFVMSRLSRAQNWFTHVVLAV